MAAERSVQETVRQRFAGVRPDNFVADFRIVSTESVDPPPSFASSWSTLAENCVFEDQPWLSPSELSGTSVFLVVANPADALQVALLRQLLDWADNFAEAPPIVLLPIRGDGASSSTIKEEEKAALLQLVECGIDDVIAGEPSGFALALSVCASLAKSAARSEKMDRSHFQMTRRVQEKASMEQSIEVALWQYTPQRLRMAIPPVDRNVETNGPDGLRVSGYRLGRALGGGLSARVFEADPPPGQQPAFPGGEVLRVMRKSSVRHVSDLVSLHRSCQVMRMLSTNWRHPNIVNILGIYHSPTNIYFRMERAGAENLYQRLQARDRAERRLSEKQLRLVATQVASAIDHMHSGPHICHRDIKPENVVVYSETKDSDITVKLIDFDFAVQLRGSRCRASCGTFPFVAPEVVASDYDGMAADMWSTGVLLLEVACGVRTMEKKLTESGWDPAQSSDDKPPTEAVQRLAGALSDAAWVRDIVLSDSVPELSTVASWFAPIVCGLIKITAAERFTSNQLVVELAS
mmetsp:Transcript_89955/g.226220  ORF Transcript_89955/g.226220 Transcript_89955/m.226220 type:complete len:520 (-) Transcript_89955:107-1666(-)